MNAIHKRVEEIQKKIPSRVTVVGVTKFQSLDNIQKGIQSGITALGVNYVQDGKKLMEALPEPELQWHFIGHIQSRKVRDLPAYHWIQSLDRVDVAEMLNLRMQQENRKINVLVEVNVGEEQSKAGVQPSELNAFLKNVKAFPFLSLRGLMAMPPPLQPIENRRPYFQKMRELFELHRGETAWDTLSMGTSEDYLLAVEEGSNMVRLGTVLFGERQ